MQVSSRQDAANFNDFLAFVDDFAVGECAEMIQPAPSSPNDSTWLDGLEELFCETSPPQTLPDTSRSCNDTLKELNPTKAEQSLSLTAAPSTKGAKRFFGRPRVSRKEELEYLRLKVKEMENKLHELKEKSDSRSPPSTTPSSPDNLLNSMHVENSIALWKRMAERQKTQRELVEVENVKLREKLKTQVRMAKSLKRILCKRTRDEDQVSNTPKRTRPLLHSVTGIFDEMLQCLDGLYVETDKHIAHCPVASMANPVLRKRDVKASDTAGMFLEFQDSKLWPFDLQTVSTATWRFLTETGVKFNKYIEEHVEMRDDTMLRKFGVEFKHGDSVAVLFGRQVTRRYVASDRVVLVRHSIIDEIQLPGTQTSGLTFRESGWIVLRSIPALGSRSATLTQGYSTMTPDIDLNAEWEVGTLTDFVLHSREDIEVGNDTIIESLLLEEAAKQSAQ